MILSLIVGFYRALNKTRADAMIALYVSGITAVLACFLIIEAKVNDIAENFTWLAGSATVIALHSSLMFAFGEMSTGKSPVTILAHVLMVTPVSTLALVAMVRQIEFFNLPENRGWFVGSAIAIILYSFLMVVFGRMYGTEEKVPTRIEMSLESGAYAMHTIRISPTHHFILNKNMLVPVTLLPSAPTFKKK